MAMKILSRSSQRGERFEEFARSGSQPIGGAREFATFALLILCLAVTVAVVFGHRHRAVNGTKSQPTTPAHRAIAPYRNPQSEPPIASGEDYTELMTAAAGNLGNSAVNAENVVVEAVVSLVWDPALGLSNQVVGFIANSTVNPVTGDRIIFNAAPGASRMAVAILAFAMVGVVMMVLASPLYASWKSWRLSREHAFRNHSHRD
jgi:hypothetical protein